MSVHQFIHPLAGSRPLCQYCLVGARFDVPFDPLVIGAFACPPFVGFANSGQWGYAVPLPVLLLPPAMAIVIAATGRAAAAANAVAAAVIAASR